MRGLSPYLGLAPSLILTTMKKIISIVFLLLFAFFVKDAKADTLSMTVDACGYWSGCNLNGQGTQIGNSFIPSDNNISAIEVKLYAFSGAGINCGDVSLRLCSDINCNNVLATGYVDSNSLPYQDTYPNTFADYRDWVKFSFASPASVNIGQTYYFYYNSASCRYQNYCCDLGNPYANGVMIGAYADPPNRDSAFKLYFEEAPVFAITSPEQNEMKINDSWITVSGTCVTNGSDQIAFTNVCSDFSNLEYTVDCVNNQFSADFYYNGVSDWVVAVDKNSVAGDCVDYDDLMDVVEVDGIEVIEGYPDDWYFNYDYYDDYDIEIVSPIFDMPALTLPLGSSNVDMTFSFIYPRPLSPNLVFNMKQYDEDGNLLNDAYHTKALYEMADTDNYAVNLTASSSPIHYVVQLLNNGNLVRQYPFGVFVSDLNLIINPDEYRYLFPRLVEKLKKKVVFNYYFAFYDGFYTLFNTSPGQINDDALDITFKSVSADGEYNLDIPVFLGSNPAVKSFAGGLRPYITIFLWLIFAVYVLVRVNHLFNNDD